MTSTYLAGVLVMAAAVVAACGDDSNCESCTLDGGAAGTGGKASGGGMADGGASAGGAEGGKAALAYCDCMLLACHDAYHDAFGPDSDEMAARANCVTQAALWPEVGMDADMGFSVECRMHYCTLGMSDDSVCPNTIGGVCED